MLVETGESQVLEVHEFLYTDLMCKVIGELETNEKAAVCSAKFLQESVVQRICAGKRQEATEVKTVAA